MFTARAGTKGDGISWSPFLSPALTHVCEHNHLPASTCRQVTTVFVTTHLCDVVPHGGRETL